MPSLSPETRHEPASQPEAAPPPSDQVIELSAIPFTEMTIEISADKVVITERGKPEEEEARGDTTQSTDQQPIEIPRDSHVAGLDFIGSKQEQVLIRTSAETRISRLRITNCEAVTVEPETAIESFDCSNCGSLAIGPAIHYFEESENPTYEPTPIFVPHDVQLRLRGGKTVPVRLYVPESFDVKIAIRKIEESWRARSFPVVSNPSVVVDDDGGEWIRLDVVECGIGTILITALKHVALGHISGGITASDTGELEVLRLEPKIPSSIQADVVRAGRIESRFLNIAATEVHADVIDIDNWNEPPTTYAVDQSYVAGDLQIDGPVIHARDQSTAMEFRQVDVGSHLHRIYGGTITAQQVHLDSGWLIVDTAVQDETIAIIDGNTGGIAGDIKLSSGPRDHQGLAKWHLDWLRALQKGLQSGTPQEVLTVTVGSNGRLRLITGSGDERVVEELSLADFIHGLSDSDLFNFYVLFMTMPAENAKKMRVIGSLPPRSDDDDGLDFETAVFAEWSSRNIVTEKPDVLTDVIEAYSNSPHAVLDLIDRLTQS